jgi:hypothetical protein
LLRSKWTKKKEGKCIEVGDRVLEVELFWEALVVL